ncbi:MAG: right-handed parallel beta-helix repeat-containing protein [Candidatus Omnitrophica bacterium]|nr:right-handed parallel beta-helix repeat-containing protein [Candidatus Omnitrophota bacterium]
MKTKRNMKKKKFIITLAICIGTIVFSIILTLSKSSYAESELSEVYEITFSPEDLIFSKSDEGYDKVDLPDCISTRFVGSPELPHKILQFIIPRDKEVTGVKIIEDITEEITGEYYIYPAQESVRYGEEQKFTPPDSDIYSSSEYFPGIITKEPIQGNLSGFNIASVCIYPLRYQPVEKKLLLHREIRFQLIYENRALPKERIDHTQRTPIGTDRIQKFLKKVVYNPQEVDVVLKDLLSQSPKGALRKENIGVSRSQGGRDNRDSIDYLIITNNTLRNSGVFDPLLLSRENEGYITMIETVESINTNYTGVDTQEKIRNYINDLHQNNGLIYVLLGGDSGIVPIRNVGCDVVPCDMYYSCLDGTWDSDNDNLFGEMGDDVDLYPDVFVGRAAVDNQIEAQSFVDKILSFESHPFSDYGDDKALFLGCDDFEDAGGTTKDLIDTLYMPPIFDPITKLYERYGTLNSASVIANLNDGYYFVNHIDHASIDKLKTGNDYIYISDIDNLSNAPYFSILWSCGCWPAAIDFDCIAEHWITSPSGGGIAFVGNSRFGVHPESDLMLDPEFYKSIFLEHFSRIGETLADSKITFIPEANSNSVMRYCMYELNLLGDPALKVLPDIEFIWIQEHPEIFYYTIQDAVDAAQDGETVIVPDGIYSGPGNTCINFNGKNITIKSYEDNPEDCIIDCAGGFYGFVLLNGENDSSVIQGFTIKNASSKAIFCDGATPKIKNCIITDCETGIYYGASNLSDATFKIEGTTIKDNAAQGIICGITDSNNSSVIIENSDIKDNEGTGVAYKEYGSVSDSYFRISESTIEGNKDTGIYYKNSVDSTGPVAYINNSNILNNENSSLSGTGLFIRNYSHNDDIDFNISRCIFANNESSFSTSGGGAIDVEGAATNATINLTITHCDIVNNTNGTYGGAVFLDIDNYNLNISNSIVWGNTPNSNYQINCIPFPTPDNTNVNYCNIENGSAQSWFTAGQGNIDADPLFVDPDNDDYRLLFIDYDDKSPCIDAGTSGGYGAASDMGRLECTVFPWLFGTPLYGVIPANTPIQFDIWNGNGYSGPMPLNFDFSCSPIPPGEPQPTLQSSGSTSAAFSWTPTEEQIGDYVFSFTVSNGTLSHSRPVFVEVMPEVPVFYVEPGFSIQGTVNWAPNGSIIIVADGTYYEGDTYIWQDDITLKSENGPQNCIIDASGYDRAFIMVENNAGISIEGFTIESPTSTAFLIHGDSSSPTISNCIIQNPGYAGIDIAYGAMPSINNCVIEGSGEGYGIKISQESFPEISGCEISNFEHGIYMTESNATIEGCIISDNNSLSAPEEYGAGIYIEDVLSVPEYGNTVEIKKCVISDNTAYSGSAIFSGWSDEDHIGLNQIHLINCTLAGNYSEGYNNHYSIYFETIYSAANSAITNCILWDYQAHLNIIYDCTITYCDIRNGSSPPYSDDYWDGNLFDVDPEFIDPENGNYSLPSISPCIDEAIDVGLPYYGVAPDMGRYEFNPNIRPKNKMELEIR